MASFWVFLFTQGLLLSIFRAPTSLKKRGLQCKSWICGASWGVGPMIRRTMYASHAVQTAAKLFWFVSRWDWKNMRSMAGQMVGAYMGWNPSSTFTAHDSMRQSRATGY